MKKSKNMIELIWQQYSLLLDDLLHDRSWWGFWSDYLNIRYELWKQSEFLVNVCFLLPENVLELSQGFLFAQLETKFQSTSFYGFVLICYCQSDFTVFVTKLLIRQFTLLIYIFTNHYSLYSPLNRVLQILCTYICKSVLHRYSKRTDENTFSDLIPTTKTLCHYFPQLSEYSDSKWSTSTIKKSRTLFPDQE